MAPEERQRHRLCSLMFHMVFTYSNTIEAELHLFAMYKGCIRNLTWLIGADT